MSTEGPIPVPEGSRWFFVVYDHPKDFPKHIVVRGWIFYGDPPQPRATNWYRLYPDYLTARLEIEEGHGLKRYPRLPFQDDPCIIETWM